MTGNFVCMKINYVLSSLQTVQCENNLIIKEITRKYKSTSCLADEETVPLSNFLIKEIRRIKIDTVLVDSKNGCQNIFDVINLIIKLINYFFSSSSDIFFLISLRGVYV